MPPADNKAMREEAEATVDLIGPHQRRFWEEMIAIIQAKLAANPPPAAGTPSTPPRQPPPPMRRTPSAGDDYAAAEEIAEWIAEHYEDVPSKASGWASNAAETAASIWETIEERGRVTEKQLEALQNIQTGIQKWLKD